MKKMLLVVACALFLLSGNTIADEADAIIGQWYPDREEKDSIVEIFKENGVYNGRIVWLKNPNNDDGTPKVDKNNPDEARRKDPLVGMVNLKGFTYKGNNKWAGGSAYDPDNGKTYKCKMALNGNDLKVRGFIGVSLLGRTMVWLRK